MDTPKTGQAAESQQSSEPARIGPKDSVPRRERQAVEVLELAIEETVDRGNDPYNNTGEQILLRLRRDNPR